MIWLVILWNRGRFQCLQFARKAGVTHCFASWSAYVQPLFSRPLQITFSKAETEPLVGRRRRSDPSSELHLSLRRRFLYFFLHRLTAENWHPFLYFEKKCDSPAKTFALTTDTHTSNHWPDEDRKCWTNVVTICWTCQMTPWIPQPFFFFFYSFFFLQCSRFHCSAEGRRCCGAGASFH